MMVSLLLVQSEGGLATRSTDTCSSSLCVQRMLVCSI